MRLMLAGYAGVAKPVGCQRLVCECGVHDAVDDVLDLQALLRSKASEPAVTCDFTDGAKDDSIVQRKLQEGFEELRWIGFPRHLGHWFAVRGLPVLTLVGVVRGSWAARTKRENRGPLRKGALEEEAARSCLVHITGSTDEFGDGYFRFVKGRLEHRSGWLAGERHGALGLWRKETGGEREIRK